MIKYLALIRHNHNVKLLSFVQLICYFGMWFSHTGIFTLLIELNAPVWAITTAAAMAFIPNVILAPINGIVIDKFNAKKLLIALMSVETITVLMLIFINNLSQLWFLFGIIFIRMGVGVMYFQTEMSLLPKLLSKKHLKLANEIHSIIWAVAYTAGMSLAGIFIHYFGITASFLADFILYLIGLMVLINLKVATEIAKKAQNALKMMSEGILYLRKNPLIIHLIFLHAFVGITAYDNLIALLANYEYKGILSISLIIGFMNAARAISLIIGPVFLSRFIGDKAVFWLFVAQGGGIVAWAAMQFNFYLGFLGLALAGFATSSLWSYTYTMLQNACDKQFYGRVIAYQDMIYSLVSVAISLIIGVLFDLGISLLLITLIMGSLFFIGAVYYKTIYNRYIAQS